jgi:hypothetical protein
MAKVADTGEDEFLKRISHDEREIEGRIAKPLPSERPPVI